MNTLKPSTESLLSAEEFNAESFLLWQNHMDNIQLMTNHTSERAEIFFRQMKREQAIRWRTRLAYGVAFLVIVATAWLTGQGWLTFFFPLAVAALFLNQARLCRLNDQMAHDEADAMKPLRLHPMPQRETRSGLAI